METVNFTQAGAVQNTWYTAFQGYNVDFLMLGAGITVANETVEMRITVDGTVITQDAGVACIAGGNAFYNLANVFYTANGTDFYTSPGAAAAIVAGSVALLWASGANVKIEVRKTTAAGGSALRCLGLYYQH